MQEKRVTLKEYLKSNWLVLLAGILVFFAGLWLNARQLQDFPDATWVAYAINLLPGLFLLLFWFLASTFRRLRWLFIGSGLLLALLAIGVAYLMYVGGAILKAATTPVQDPTRYEEFLDLYPEEWVAHFPKHIPDSATEVAFYYSPSFLQAGSSLQLHFTLPRSEVGAVLRQYQSNAIELEDKKEFAPTRFINKQGTDFEPLSVDFQVLVLGAEPHGDDLYWNHGHTYGIAVSTERQEVIYWAEYW